MPRPDPWPPRRSFVICRRTSTAGDRAEPARSRPEWVDGLLSPSAYPHPVGEVKLVETHISWVFLTGPYAYKVKKPVSLGFLDFSSFERRRHFCHEEVRINRRFAPGLYLGVVPIGGTPSAPRVGDDTLGVLEWGVKLVQFDENDRLDARLDTGRLGPEDCRRLGAEIASVEAALDVADPSSGQGAPDRLSAVFTANLDQVRLHRPDLAPDADAVGAWLRGRLTRDRDAFLARVAAGRIRECHGDLHLANIVLLDGRPVAFDAIEFNPDLRWIDVAADVAFVTMDLAFRGRADLAAEVTSAWMEAADDHAAATVLPVHRAARAVVRAAVSAIRAAQPGCPAEVARLARDATGRYLAFARALARAARPSLIVVTGPSGSGKSTLAGTCVGRFGAVRLRSDVERKRISGMTATERPSANRVAALYSSRTTRRVYERLASLAGGLLAAGSTVVVDATCTARWQRDLLASAARDARVGLAWLEIDLPLDMLLSRVEDRARIGTDPSDATAATVRAQLAAREPFDAAEVRPMHGPGCVLHRVLDAQTLARPEPILDEVMARLDQPAARETDR